jgi:MoxR-like ATPase
MEVCPLGTWQDFEDRLQAQFLERREVIHGLLVALVARQHVLLIGPPGAAKSELARTVCGAVGGRFFRTTLTPTSTPDELLGPVSAKRLIEDDVIARNLDGSLATADIAAVDEIWKCNAATLNCLLSVINEREVTDAGRPLPVPLRTLVGTSNELPQEEGLTALWDRFALRYQVGYLKDPGDFLRLLAMPETAPVQGPTLAEVDAAGRLLDSIAWDGVRETFLKLWTAARQTWRVSVSDRRWKWCLRLCRANALLAGRNEAQPADLLVLADALWEEPDQRLRIRQELLEIVDPALREAEELTDAAEEQWQKAMAVTDGEPKDVMAVISEAAKKIRKSAARLEELRDIARGRGRDTAELERALERVQTWNRSIHQKLTDRYMAGGAAS